MGNHTEESKNIEFTIVVPAFNEEHRIGPTLDDYIKYFSNNQFGMHEIIVVLNGCVDGTRSVVQRFERMNSHVRLIEFKEPLGKGGAIVEGFASALGEHLLFIDADNMVEADQASKLLDALKRTEIAIGDRVRGQQIGGSRSLTRWAISFLNRVWSLIFLNIPYKDTQCGAKALRSSAWLKIAPFIEERYWAFDLDLIAQARALNLSIEEVPVRWNHVEEGSKVRPLIDVPKTFLSTFGIKRRVLRTKSSTSFKGNMKK